MKVPVTTAIIGLLSFGLSHNVAAEDFNGSLNTAGVTVNPRLLPLPTKTWEPGLNVSGTKKVSCRLFDYGGDKVTKGTYDVVFRQASKSPLGEGHGSPLVQKSDYDVDGDGDTTDDHIAYIPFSEEKTLSSPEWPYSQMLPENWNKNFYGGYSVYFGNKSEQKGKIKAWTEMGCNPNHGGCYNSFEQENHPLNASRGRKNVTADTFINAFWTIFWRKQDFMNGGDKYPVSFGEESRIATVIARGYWSGIDKVRFIVKDGDEWYISDNTSYGLPEKFGGFSCLYLQVSPNEITWAKYSGLYEGAHLIHFDDSTATFEKHTFTDIQAVGWHQGKYNNSTESAHSKWYAAACDAVVEMPDVPSIHIKTVPVNNTFMAATEVPYALWKKVFRFAEMATYTFEAKYNFDKYGDMGSARYGDEVHEQDEPVTNIAYYDALAWCNALSEMEGKEPCYYTDSAFTNVFRNNELGVLIDHKAITHQEHCSGINYPHQRLEMPTIYVKWNTDGWRLPTPSEWQAANAGEVPEQTAATGTATVAAQAANAQGLYDMNGNVWELLWTHGDTMPAQPEKLLAVGGDFHVDNAPEQHPTSPMGDVPWKGMYNIGFRPLCRPAGTEAPAIGNVSTETPSWTLIKDQRIGVQQNAKEELDPAIELVEIPAGSFFNAELKREIHIGPFAYGKTELTFDQWNTVLQWAEANDYHFGESGAMGSHYNFHFKHRGDEPVTMIDWHDALIWCNAYSEMKGSKPLYYSDVERTQVLRKGYKYRPFRIPPSEYTLLNEVKIPGMEKYSTDLMAKHTNHVIGNLGRNSYSREWIYTDWSANGFRLPTANEYLYAAKAGTTSTYYWGEDKNESIKHVWGPRNAGGRTHPVGQKPANAFGLHDIIGNVGEMCFGDIGKRNKMRNSADDVIDPKGDISFASHMYLKTGKTSKMWYPAILGGSWFERVHGVGGKKQEVISDVHGHYTRYSFLGMRIAQNRPMPFVSIKGTDYRVIGPLAGEVHEALDKELTLKGEIMGSYFYVKAIEEGGAR